MGRVLLVVRLVVRDLRRRPGEAMLLLVAILAATTTLTLGLVLHGVTDHPYDSTRAATAGPDVVATVVPLARLDRPADTAALEPLAHASGVVATSGPYPVAGAEMTVHGQTVAVEAEGRDSDTAAVDRPKLTSGGWTRPGGVVVESALADALHLTVGDSISLNGRPFRIAGVAITAATPPYPSVPQYTPSAAAQGTSRTAHADTPDDRGLVWLTETDTRGIAASANALSYVMNIKLADPDAAQAFVAEHTAPAPAPGLRSWQDIRTQAADLVRNEQRVLVTGAWLLGILAVASVAVLVGGRMAGQVRRVGLLKAVGGTPGLLATVLLAEYVVVALTAAAAGLAIGWLVAPTLADPGAGLLGTAGTPPITTGTIGLVVALALGVAVLATVLPALRAARTSTVRALADAARPPRRTTWLVSFSARLPVTLLLGLRIAARRPRRLLLAVASIAITVSGIVAALAADTKLHAHQLIGPTGLDDPRTDRLSHVLLIITITLIVLAAVNGIVLTWATVLDNRHASALTRALGATPNQVSAGMSAAQVLPALVGAVLGIPGGLALNAAITPESVTPPAAWTLIATVVLTVLVMAGLTTVPARLGARQPAAEILQTEAT